MSKSITYRDYEVVLELCDDLWYFSVYGHGDAKIGQVDRGYPKQNDAIKSAKHLIDAVVKHPHAYGYY